AVFLYWGFSADVTGKQSARIAHSGRNPEDPG
ncbi:unnamed protein product, partial [marine sediment metagenome]